MLVQLVCLVIFHTVLADQIPKQSYDVSDYEVIGHYFEKYINEYNKNYNEHEKAVRFHNFIDNLKNINRLNKEHPMALFDISEFTDLTKEEGESRFGFGFNPMGSPIDHNGDCKVLGDPSTKDAPDSWDWRDTGVVSPVKNQKSCGSCWAFSTAALLESRNLQAGKKVILSEQQLLDCDTKSARCRGGFITYALTYIMHQGGQESESDYSYESKNDTCRFDASKVVAKVSNCSAYEISNEDALKELLYKEGPLAIAVYATTDWLQYKTGIYSVCEHGPLVHAVLLVGYGSENGQDYWVIKNSQGVRFGDKGYIKIKRGQNCSGIGSQTNPAYAVVSASVIV